MLLSVVKPEGVALYQEWRETNLLGPVEERLAVGTHQSTRSEPVRKKSSIVVFFHRQTFSRCTILFFIINQLAVNVIWQQDCVNIELVNSFNASFNLLLRTSNGFVKGVWSKYGPQSIKKMLDLGIGNVTQSGLRFRRGI